MQKLNRKTIIFISIIIIFIIGIYYFFIREKEYIESNSDLNILITEETNKIENNEKQNNINSKIVIYITGAVKNEGIYELDENSRIADSIEKAGGLTEDANISNINLAYMLEDGMKVYIPKNSDNNEVEDNTNIYISKEDSNTETSTTSKSITTKTAENTSNRAQDTKININTATQTELEMLPGIGPSIATKIVNYRKENGKFTNIEDIKKVSGIGDSKYSQIKDLIKT